LSTWRITTELIRQLEEPNDENEDTAEEEQVGDHAPERQGRLTRAAGVAGEGAFNLT
jgi:hypothetical protein